jgi:hypothetical protein
VRVDWRRPNGTGELLHDVLLDGKQLAIEPLRVMPDM